MKRLLALFLVLLMVFSLVACGEKEETPDTDSSIRGDSHDDRDNNDDGGDDNDDNSPAADHQTFDDLAKTWAVGVNFLAYRDDVEGELYLRCGIPDDFRVDPTLYGFYVEKAHYGAVIVCAGEYTPGITVDDAFDSVYTENFLHTLKQWEGKKTWEEFTPDTTERMTINGREVIHFTGKQEGDSYGTYYAFLVYGYCVIIENIPVIVAAVAGDPELDYFESAWVEDDMVATKHYADEMIRSLYALDHWEEYGEHD